MSIHDWIEPLTWFMDIIEQVLELPFPFAMEFTWGQVFIASTILVLILGLFFELARK